jgi:hypothetical protein
MISLARLKLMLGITTSDSEPLLVELLDAAVAFVQTQTNRYFGLPVATREYHPGRGTRELFLLSIPYAGTDADDIDITEQKAPGVSMTALAGANDDGYELRTSPRSAWLTRAGGYIWRWGYEYVTDYLHGYDQDTLPPDIEALIARLVKRRLDRVQAGEYKSETFDNYSYTRFDDDDLSDEDKATIHAWREPVIA